MPFLAKNMGDQASQIGTSGGREGEEREGKYFLKHLVTTFKKEFIWVNAICYSRSDEWNPVKNNRWIGWGLEESEFLK